MHPSADRDGPASSIDASRPVADEVAIVHCYYAWTKFIIDSLKMHGASPMSLVAVEAAVPNGDPGTFGTTGLQGTTSAIHGVLGEPAIFDHTISAVCDGQPAPNSYASGVVVLEHTLSDSGIVREHHSHPATLQSCSVATKPATRNREERTEVGKDACAAAVDEPDFFGGRGYAVDDSQTVNPHVNAIADQDTSREPTAVDHGCGRSSWGGQLEPIYSVNDDPAWPGAGSYFDAITGLRIIDGALEIHHIDMRLLPAVPGGDGKNGEVRPTSQFDVCQVIKPCCGGSAAGDGGE
jgi:hypothetical protein